MRGEGRRRERGGIVLKGFTQRVKSAKMVIDADKVQALRAMLQIPEEEEVMSVIAIGKRDKEPVLRPRKALSDVVTIF